jgi:alpha-beta hydrolase superfamily lysophospholipase
MYLQPTKVPAGAKKLTMRSKTDTMYVAFDTISHQPTLLSSKKDTLPFDFELESVVYASSNGHKLNGWMMKPKGQQPAITILHMHGNAGFLLQQYEAMTPLLKNGFQIFVFDYSGFGFSEGKATRKNVLTDALSTLDYLKGRADVKGTKLVLYGQSLGGHLSAVVAAQREKDIDALVVEGAFSSHKDIAADMVPVLGRVCVKEGYSAKRSIKEFHKPVLIIHSTEDATIPFKMGKKIFAAANAPKDFYEIKQCHICGPSYYPDEISEKIKKMLEQL